MERASSKKTEEKAITKINELIDNIKCASSNIQKNDKTISWDGTIDFYSGSIDKKKNYDFSVDVQVKGRTRNKKKLDDKSQFEIDVLDLKNFLKKDGTLLLVVEFKKDSDEYKIYYSSLLPYDIHKELEGIKGTSVEKIKVKMKMIKNADHLESICKNFQLNKDIQKRMNKESFINDYNRTTPATKAKFSVWEKDAAHFTPESLVGQYQYIYEINENGDPVGISYSMIYNMSKEINTEISTVDKSIVYKDLVYVKTMEEELFTFGKAFTINSTFKKFDIKICGTLNERISELQFINNAISDKMFLIGDSEFKLNDDITGNEQFITLEKNYITLRNLLNKRKITKDLNLDTWKNEEITELLNWLDAIENNKDINLNSANNLLGSKTINEVKLSVIASKQENGMFKVEPIWNGGKYNRYNFKFSSSEKEIITDNIFLNLNKEAYLADDINYDEMKSSFTDELTEDENILLNFQVLDVIEAYDISKDIRLLDYAEYLTSLLLKKDTDARNIYYINYCQILKRKGNISNIEMEELIRIRDSSSEDEIKLCCNALLDNKIEKDIILKRLDNSTINILKSYPISIYF